MLSLRSRFLVVSVAALATALLAGCPTVDLGDTPPDPGQCRPDFAYFQSVVWDQYIAPADTELSCVDAVGCHRDDDGRSGFRVAMPAGDAPVDYRGNYDRVVFFLNCNDPASSRLLTKPISGVIDHAGGDLFGPGSEAEAAFLDWFSQ